MALKKVKGNFERMFDKNLTDLVRGIRNNKDNESKYIAQCMEEIKVELRQENIAVKANAVAKLTYLQMLGYDISWAIFNIIEVMSSNKFTYKRIGYLAASQSFHADSELLMLTTNMIRKDLNAQNQYEAGLALSGLSCFISHDLARDLANDIMTLMSSTKPYLRMKAVLMMYKVFLRYPEALRPAFPKLKEKLEDPDPGVQSAAVNVVCELARKNPKNYLSLAPVFFKLMTTSTNNWMLIKIIKLFGALTPLEPRLGKKLIEPLTNLIHSTSAMSLLYECINTVIAVLISISSGMPGHAASVQLCVQKLRILIEDSDQNLKYLGLLAMSRILKSHPKSVQAHKDLVLACLDDKDESIRLRALGLLYGMVSKKNLMEIVKKLMVHMDRAEGTLYRDELLTRIIEICSQNNYQHVVDFECTSAMSLLYECINTVIAVLISISSGMPGHAASVQLCVQKLRILIEDSDQNLKYLGLLAMSRILKSHPKSVQAHKDLVLACLDDKDESIRLRALGLLYGMVSKKNLMEIVKKLMVHMDRAEGTLYRDELLTRIIEICSQNNYQHVVDFEWYVTVLTELTEMETSAKHGRMVAAQLTEVGARVAEVRAFAARECGALVARAAAAPPGPASREVLYAAAYVLPEYCREESVMRESVSGLLIIREALAGLRPLLCSEDMEVQERSHNATALLTIVLRKISPNDCADLPPMQNDDTLLVEHEQSNGVEKEENIADVNGESSTQGFSGGLIEELAELFEGELKPVAPKAQKKVPMPSDLNLEQWVCQSRWSSESSSSEGEGEAAVFAPAPRDARPTAQFTPEELAMLREARRQEQANNPHYLKDDSPRSYQQDDVPIAEIALEIPLQVHKVAKVEVDDELLIDDLSQTNGKKTVKASDGAEEEAIAAEPNVKGTKTEKHKKSKKESKDKESKRNKSSKKGKHEKKTGYEEALGISTPSKEVI
uniref:AP-3 complex subunit delta n=1 Tax=Heliothis virescens TaxID=7102 RepID=A0A2A4ISS4_HELVI